MRRFYNAVIVPAVNFVILWIQRATMLLGLAGLIIFVAVRLG